jgi:hypothetical protein
MDMLKTQKLDASFIVRYILNSNYQLTEEEENITMETVLKLQTHLTLNELLTALVNYKSDDDSVDDFETVSNKK